MKNFFKKLGGWFKTHAPTKRRLIQLYSVLLFNANIKGYFGKGNNVIFRGGTKYLCTPGLNCYSCPGAITACPLGALQNAMASSKTRAPYYIIGILCLLGLMLGRTICGFLCPTGLGQDLLYKIKTPKLRKSRYTRFFSYFKYVLLAVFVIAIPVIYQGIPAFCKYICPAGTFGGSLFLLMNPNNSDFFAMLGYLFSWKFVVLVVFAVASVFIYRFFCRFICPLGAILGFFNKFALIGVSLDNGKCTDCGLCVQTCKMDVKRVGDHECINCGECIPVCPTKAIGWKGAKLFLHPSATDDLPVPAVEKAPLAAMAANGSENGNSVLQDLNANVSGTTETDTVEVFKKSNSALATEQTSKGEELSCAREKKKLTPAEKILKRNFGLQIGAWALAVVLLITALVYYNFLAPTNVTQVYALGDKCPDFTLTTYDTQGAYTNGIKADKFSSLEHKGTVMVINFWYTTCDPCVEELPYFETVKEKFGNKVVMVAVHAANMVSESEVQSFIDGKGWRDWQIIFAQDTSETDCFSMLGGKSAYPLTVVVNTSGVISFVQHGKTSEAALSAAIENAM